MTTEQGLDSAVSDYSVQAKELETTRQALVERIMGIVRTEIVPRISPLLPDGYSINTDTSGVWGYSMVHVNMPALGSIPAGFNVDLQLRYDGSPRIRDGKPMSLTQVYDEEDAVQHELSPKLEELAHEFNLGRIYLRGLPNPT